MIEIRLARDIEDIKGIKALQEANLNLNITPEEAMKEGFVAARYSLEFLQLIHAAHPSVIAVDHDTVVGYALVSTQKIREEHPLLADLFNAIDNLQYQGRSLQGKPYVVIGQLCIAKTYRGQGLVQQLYGYFRETLSKQYDCCITDVAKSNPRSLKAHLKTGFVVINSLDYGGIGWDIVLWDWTTKAG